MVRNAVQKASVYREVPRRQSRKIDKTWSPTKDECERTKEKVRHALRLHAYQHPGEAVVLFDIARNLSLTPNHVRLIYKSISKGEEVPPTKHKPHTSPIPLDTLNAIKTALIEIVNAHRKENPNKPVSANELAKRLKRSRSLVSRLYKEIFG